MNNFEELRGMLCYSHYDDTDFSSNNLEEIASQLENLIGILNFVSSLKDEGNNFYIQNATSLAISKYSFALKILSFVLVSNDGDKSVFSALAVSLNLNLGACFIKERDFDKVGQLC